MVNGLVPRSTNAENKLAFGLTVSRVIWIGIAFMFSITCSRLVHLYLQPFFVAVNIGLVLILTRQDPISPKLKLWQGLIIYFVSSQTPKKYVSIIGSAFAKSSQHPKNRGEEENL